MTTTDQGIDARRYLAGWLAALTNMYISDVRALPDEKWNATFGGCTRPASELTADAISMLQWCAATMNGEATAGQGELIAELKDKCSDKVGACTAITEASEAFTTALNEASDETLNSVVTPPWEMPTPLFMLANIAVSHVWYHDGQLNYIHCLLGDDKVHWMGD